MPELQSTKPTVKVTVVTDEKIIPRKKACDTQDLSRKSLTHKSIGKSPAVSKRSMKLPKAQKISKADFPNAPRKAMNAYMYFAESNRKGNHLLDTSNSIIIKQLNYLTLTEIFRCYIGGPINESDRNYERVRVAVETFRGR